MGKKLYRLLTLLIWLCLAAALWFGYSFFKTLREYDRGEADLSRIYSAVGGIPEPVPKGERMQMDEAHRKEADENLKAQRIDSYLKLEAINEDTIGWVRIEGTVIDYPVMQTPDNPDFYLTHGFNKESSVYGMIYMDAGCSLEEDCRNYLLYGHHMKNGAMFASLEKYESEEYFREHPVIGFDTLTETCDYEVAAVLKLPASMITAEFSHMLAAGSKERYEALIRYAKENSLYDTGISVQWPEQLLTLTTCEYSQKNGRLLVIARQAENEKAIRR